MLENKNRHSRDSRIVFVEDTHTYYLDNKKVGTSVTTFLHDLFPKFDAKKKACDIANHR